jgi:hypothetical protein
MGLSPAHWVSLVSHGCKVKEYSTRMGSGDAIGGEALHEVARRIHAEVMIRPIEMFFQKTLFFMIQSISYIE